MADTQIVAAQVSAAPLVYQLSSGVEFTLKAVNADFDGSAAAATWLPAVVIGSDSGHVIAYALDQAVTVAAAGSAAVSWFPGVKHARGASASSADAYPLHEDMPVLSFDWNGVLFNNWDSHPTIDTACINNGYTKTDTTQNASIAFRTMLGPFGSIHSFNWLYLTGSNYGQAFLYLASIPEDDAASGAADPTGVLKDISTLSFILVAKIEMYTAATARNVQSVTGVTGPGLNFFNSTPFRVMGAVGDPFTARGFDGILNLATIDGGPGPYALKIVMEAKNGASTAYKAAIQALNRQRNDWAFS